MSEKYITQKDSIKRKRVKIFDTELAYVETGKGKPIVFLHGNPTSSYLWRNIIPNLTKLCVKRDAL